ncbi:CPBP family glutamic-type intramembrane protease [Clostridiaceae bacterium M8S5]|nr:CPBP family glutamic-type intramembrane protease [Clostridiaceae bacterium M8S5]
MVFSIRYRPKLLMRYTYYLITFIPCLSTYIVDLEKLASTSIISISLVFAVINGTIEELFWRGIFNKVFEGTVGAYMFLLVFFGLWHVTLCR